MIIFPISYLSIQHSLKQCKQKLKRKYENVNRKHANIQIHIKDQSRYCEGMLPCAVIINAEKDDKVKCCCCQFEGWYDDINRDMFSQLMI